MPDVINKWTIIRCDGAQTDPDLRWLQTSRNVYFSYDMAHTGISQWHTLSTMRASTASLQNEVNRFRQMFIPFINLCRRSWKWTKLYENYNMSGAKVKINCDVCGSRSTASAHFELALQLFVTKSQTVWTLSYKQTLSDAFAADDFWKDCEKSRNCSNRAIPPLATMF